MAAGPEATNARVAAEPEVARAAAFGLDLDSDYEIPQAGRTVAFVAQSGVGKTSLAVNLVARGAGFVTDDVLAVEPIPRGLFAYPGPGMVNVDEVQLAPLTQDGRARLGRRLGRSDKLHF